MSRLGLALAVAALGLSACEGGISYKVHNATGEPLKVLPQDEGYYPHTIAVAPGDSAKFYRNGHRLRLAAGACEATYVFRDFYPFNYPFRSADGSEPDYSYPYPIEVQVEPNLTLYLLPSKAKAVRPSEIVGTQQTHGFPWAPKSKVCASKPPG